MAKRSNIIFSDKRAAIAPTTIASQTAPQTLLFLSFETAFFGVGPLQPLVGRVGVKSSKEIEKEIAGVVCDNSGRIQPMRFDRHMQAKDFIRRLGMRRLDRRNGDTEDDADPKTKMTD
jgi:hypothetical protein